MKSLGVIHLVWVPAGIAPLERFLASYQAHPGGMTHDLVVIFNGQRTQADLAPFQILLRDVPHTPLILARPQQDLVSYHQATQTVSYSVLCFVNSYTQMRDTNWLAKLYGHLERDGVGIVGATSSCLSYRDYYREHRDELDSDPFYASPAGRVRLALLLRAYRHWYAPFPNPFIRSNAFMARRDVLSRVRVPAIRKKTHAYRFESGLHGLTRQIQAQGLRPVVVGRDGQGYEIADWHKSDTFMQGNQDNLLVEDNQTRRYQEADDTTRLQFSRNSWGPNAAPALGDEARRT